MSRLAFVLVLVVLGVVSAGVPRAQVDPTVVRIEKVKDNLYIITGGRGTGAQAATVSGNTTVFITNAGVVLVDTKLPGYGKGVLDLVKSVTAKPVTTIINTHSHNDHTGGNNEFPRSVEFIAHENTKTNMVGMDAFKGENAVFVPKRTFENRLSLFDGMDRIDLYYFGRGHTNGDTVIVLPALRTVVMGDLFARKWAPLVDANNGGSTSAYPETLAKVVAGLKDLDTVITGHATTTSGSGREATFARSNPVMRWTDLQEYADFTREFVAAAQSAMKAGKSVDEAVRDLRLPDRYKSYSMSNARNDVQLLYEELKQLR